MSANSVPEIFKVCLFFLRTISVHGHLYAYTSKNDGWTYMDNFFCCKHLSVPFLLDKEDLQTELEDYYTGDNGHAHLLHKSYYIPPKKAKGPSGHQLQNEKALVQLERNLFRIFFVELYVIFKLS